MAHRFFANADRRSAEVVHLPTYRENTGLELVHRDDFVFASLVKFKSRFGTDCPFPFLTSLLLEGITPRDCLDHWVWVPLPLEKMHSATHPSYGAVVIDITNLNEFAYGIIASRESLFSEKTAGENPGNGEPARAFTVPWDARNEKRGVISLEQYLRSLWSAGIGHIDSGDIDGCEMREGAINLCSGIPLVARKVLRELWSDVEMCAIQALSRGDSNACLGDHTILRQLQHIPSFKSTLQKCLFRFYTMESSPETLVALIRFAWENEEHLLLGAMYGLSCDLLAAALQTDELNGASTISIGVNCIKGSFDRLADGLASMPNLETIYLLTNPSIAGAATDDLAQHCKVLDVLVSKFGSKMVRDRVLSTAPYALKFKNKMLFDDVHKMSPTSPVYGIYYRVEVALDERGWLYYSCATDHMNLGAEAIVARLLRWTDLVSSQYYNRLEQFAYGSGRLHSSDGEFTLRPRPRQLVFYPENECQLATFVSKGERIQWILLIEEDTGMELDERVTSYAFVKLENCDGSSRAVAYTAEQFLVLEAPDADIGGLAEMLQAASLGPLAYQAEGDILQQFFSRADWVYFMRRDDLKMFHGQHLIRGQHRYSGITVPTEAEFRAERSGAAPAV
ncbi:hypothetical protein NLG97_g9125 [Lecanicillium saksenae]|uniref:Uncharacterized protein n=1 Tax=Lecanicillium saksenae TaxID=468837 RepID=A0ACC1QIW4_9HYPO|nr:hypothetical protein NLG97_g9125 [Lecanicillium saksenae]